MIPVADDVSITGKLLLNEKRALPNAGRDYPVLSCSLCSWGLYIVFSNGRSDDAIISVTGRDVAEAPWWRRSWRDTCEQL